MGFCIVVLAALLNNIHCGSSLGREKELIFDSYPGQKLTLQNSTEAKQESTLVEDNMGCAFECTNLYWCYSINFKITPQSNGLHVCELLSYDQFTNKSYMTENNSYNHYSIKVQRQKLYSNHSHHNIIT